MKRDWLRVCEMVVLATAVAMLILAVVVFLTGCDVPDNELKTYIKLAHYYCEGDDEAGEQLIELGYELPDCR